MKLRALTVRLIASMLIVVSVGTSAAFAQREAADIVFKNGNVYTANDRQPRAEAIAVKGSKIVFVGSNRDVQAYQGKRTRVVDLRGNTVVPGLTDSHYHLSGVGAREMNLNLEGTTSLEDFLGKVKARVDRARAGQWVTGRGWIETFWSPPVFPSRWDLDRIAPNNPVYLTRADGHGAVANSAALKIAGIDKSTVNPFGGEIMKDKKSGEPNGMLLDKAQALVTTHIPAPTESDNEQAILLGARRSVELGWTQIQNAGSSYQEIARFKKLYEAGQIKLRVYNAVYGPTPNSKQLIESGAMTGLYDNRFTVRAIKVVMDGALGSKGAALLEPYSDHDTSGFLTSKEEDVFPMLLAALRSGIQVESHAIGDRANRVILDLYERAFKEVPASERKVREPRWRIEHAQILHPDDINRFSKLGVIASMQPSHAIGDLHFAPSRVGIKRLEGAYAWQ
ncbi:MAG TPA: amidohydrolase, partial [Blastocatellia bacterium]|nr:amidohydrolase [Blastocatellia bacterium]